ncbi:UDP-N-acetylglucosamine transferase subunit ALG13 homolog [Plodia interpunctella]|uniref:UDP-N-acetylglucosamine transferase subunit ALG13 homolog n=1 Tax=Plodia interpunctella TaxID=58824 RepID=UPI0023687DD3|nr:UDP-N-acetylglucosamine transferase subunit ALG13 homolog [Plodia interpunctella]
MAINYQHIFITVGTTRFDLLVETIFKPSCIEAVKKLGCKTITFQIGNSDFEPGDYVENGVKLQVYRFKDSLQEDIIRSDLVISHAGAGSCLEALEARKPLLVVVNEDLMDNHQLELAEQLQVDGHLYYCTCDTFESTLDMVDFNLLTPFPKPDPSVFVKYLDDVFRVKPKIN